MLKKSAVYDFTKIQYLFETIGYLAFWLVRGNSQHKGTLEKEVMDFFMQALKNKSDLLNFCLQIFAIILHLEPNTNPQYKSIYDSLLLP